MDDIIDIYEPIYRNNSRILFIMLISAGIIVTTIGLYFLIRYIIKRRAFLTPEMKYKKCLDDFLELQKEKTTLTDRDFSLKINNIFRTYLSTLYSSSFIAFTPEELYAELESKGVSNVNLKRLIVRELQTAYFGHGKLHWDLKDQTIKEFADTITYLYNKELSSD